MRQRQPVLLLRHSSCCGESPGGVAAAPGLGSRRVPADRHCLSRCHIALCPRCSGGVCPHLKNWCLKWDLWDNWVSKVRPRLPGVHLCDSSWQQQVEAPCADLSFACSVLFVHVRFYLSACRPGLKVWVCACGLLNLLPAGMPSVLHPLYWTLINVQIQRDFGFSLTKDWDFACRRDLVKICWSRHKCKEHFHWGHSCLGIMRLHRESGSQYWASCGLCQQLHDFQVLWVLLNFNKKFK